MGPAQRRWWENDWREIRPQHELDQLKRDGVFLDLPMWRGHRSNPKGYGSDEHARAEGIRNAEITMWELYENDPTAFR